MRKFLQSKAAVSALVIIAGLAVTANFVSIPKLLGVAATARIANESFSQSTETQIKMPPNSRFVAEQKMWQDLFPVNSGVRDPFAPIADPSTPTSKGDLSATPPPLVTPEFILQAISREPGRAYAVINQQVLAVGELVSGYKVERIFAASVDLRGPTGRISLSLPRTAVRQKTATVTAPPADLPAAIKQSSPPRMPH